MWRGSDRTARAGEPAQALRLAETVPAARGRVPAFWEAGHRLRPAAAAVQVRRHLQALGFLAEARDLAPDWVRYQPLGQATMRELVDRAPRRRGAEFSRLAAHYGLVPRLLHSSASDRMPCRRRWVPRA
jgi:hypothetical protein